MGDEEGSSGTRANSSAALKAASTGFRLSCAGDHPLHFFTASTVGFMLGARNSSSTLGDDGMLGVRRGSLSGTSVAVHTLGGRETSWLVMGLASASAAKTLPGSGGSSPAASAENTTAGTAFVSPSSMSTSRSAECDEVSVAFSWERWSGSSSLSCCCSLS